jgi:UDP-N-acetyl-D-mannosaminuronic acid transferase (WecB/TagA/CpsF family)
MRFLSLDIYRGKYGDFLEMIKHPQRKTLIFTPNPEILVQASHDREFLEILEKADHLTPDANGLYTGSLIQEGKSYIFSLFSTFFERRKLREKYGELIKGSDLTRDLIHFSEQKGKHILMIDNYRIIEPKNEFEIKKKEIQKKLPELFRQKFPELHVKIVFDGESSPEEIVSLIEKNNIEYVFSCIGMKTQEKRLVEIFAHLPGDTQAV